jgi:uncharacterized membrane protein (UPF0127 family)
MIHGSLALANADCAIKKVGKTTNFLERMCGLLGMQKLKVDEGLLIAPCSSVHTFGMRYTIDVLFLDKQMTIVKTVKSLKPWRMAASNIASMVLELADDSINKLQLKTGQQLEWHDDAAN